MIVLQHRKLVPDGLFPPRDWPIEFLAELLWGRKAGSLARCIHGSLIRKNTAVGQGFSVGADEFLDGFQYDYDRQTVLDTPWQMLIFSLVSETLQGLLSTSLRTEYYVVYSVVRIKSFASIEINLQEECFTSYVLDLGCECSWFCNSIHRIYDRIFCNSQEIATLYDLQPWSR